jgi:hypothetical protein
MMWVFFAGRFTAAKIVAALSGYVRYIVTFYRPRASWCIRVTTL